RDALYIFEHLLNELDIVLPALNFDHDRVDENRQCRACDQMYPIRPGGKSFYIRQSTYHRQGLESGVVIGVLGCRLAVFRRGTRGGGSFRHHRFPSTMLSNAMTNAMRLTLAR